MRCPRADVVLANGLKAPSREVQATAWHDHVVRHPLGLDALTAGRRPWNDEGWDATEPPVATARDHDGLIDWLNGERRSGRDCVQLHRNAPARCDACRRDLFADCVPHAADVGDRYGDVIEGSLRSVANGEGLVLDRSQATRRFCARLRERPSDPPAELVVMSFGCSRNGRFPIAQVMRGDGVRVEWYLDGAGAHRTLSFRTALRQRPGPVWGALMDYPQPLAVLGSLSEMVLVSRRLAQVLQ